MLQNHLSQNGINRGIKGKQFEGSQCLSGAIILLYQLLNEFTIYFEFEIILVLFLHSFHNNLDIMNKKFWLLIVTSGFFAITIEAQINLTDSSLQQKYDSIYINRQTLIKNNMSILGAWAGLNIIQSSISAASTSGNTQTFFKMNVYWNTVNAAIAGIGFLQAKKALTKKITRQQNWLQQQKTEQFLLLNTGLDAAYITTGLYLREHGLRKNNDQTEGFGSSIILQGSFLFVLDVIQYLEHHQNGKRLSKLCLEPANNGLGLVWHL